MCVRNGDISSDEKISLEIDGEWDEIEMMAAAVVASLRSCFILRSREIL